MRANEKGCVFCKALEQEDGPDNLIVFRGERVFVMLNRFPYTSGHMMVLPFEHVARPDQVDAETRAEMMELTNQTTAVLDKVYEPEGFNLGANLGAAAGAGIEEHLHFHVVPRWVGDTNFMSATGDTRVLPQALEDSYQEIREAWG